MRDREAARALGVTGVLGLAAAGFCLGGDARAQTAQSDLGRLEEIIVSSSIVETPRRQIGTAVSIITGEDMELRGYNSLADALRTQPSIGVSNSGGVGKTTTLRIRGEEAYRTLLMIDGVKALDPSGPQVAPSFDGLLTTSDLERVEILRGPQGFIYGADAGGVVSILTRTGEGAPSGRIGLEGGEFGTRKADASVAGGNDAVDYFFSVTDLESDGFNSQAADTVLADDDGAENTTLHAKVGWNAGDNFRLQFVARDIDATADFDGCFSSVTFTTVHDCSSDTQQTTYKVSAEHSTERFTNLFGYSDVDIARESFSEGMSSFATQGELARIEYTGSYRPTDGTTLVYGVDLQNEEISGDGADDRDQNGYYLEYQGQFGHALFLSVGARYDDNDDFGSHTSERVSLAFVDDLAGGHTLKYRASYGTGFRPPSLFEIAYNAGPFSFPPAAGFALNEETSRGYDLGVDFDAESGLHFEATYFDQEIDDAIFFDLAAFSGYLQESGTSSSTGLELAMRAPIGERFEFLGNWTTNDTETTSDVQRLRRPENLANFGMLYTSLDDRLRVVANYRLARDAIDIGNTPLDDYEVLDVSLSLSINETVEVYARIENATDEAYQEVIGYNTADRAGYAGVRLRF